MSSSWLQAGHSTFISGHLSARCPQPLHSHHVLPAVGERRFLNVMFEALCDFVHGERVRLHLIADRRISSQTTSLAPNQVWESKANINLSPFKTFFSFLFFFPKEKIPGTIFPHVHSRQGPPPRANVDHQSHGAGRSWHICGYCPLSYRVPWGWVLQRHTRTTLMEWGVHKTMWTSPSVPRLLQR